MEWRIGEWSRGVLDCLSVECAGHVGSFFDIWLASLGRTVLWRCVMCMCITNERAEFQQQLCEKTMSGLEILKSVQSCLEKLGKH